MPIDKLSANAFATGAAVSGVAPAAVANSTANVAFFAANGNIGISTNSPTMRLDVRNTSADYQLHLGDSASAILGYELGRENTGGLFKFYGNQTGATGYIFSGADGERMRVAANGNVGIGTATPGYVLETNGSPVKLNRGGKALLLNPNFGSANTSSDIQTDPGMALTFSPAGTERVRIDSSGNFGVGSNTPGSFGKLFVAGGNIIADFDREIGFQWQGGVNQYFKGMSGINQSTALARGLHIFNYDNDANQGINFWGGTYSSRIRLGTFENDATFKFNSGFGSVATAYGVRAWVNFDAASTGSPVIQSSGNISSIGDRGAGQFTINFTNAMPDANYALSGSVESQTGWQGVTQFTDAGGGSPATASNKGTSQCMIVTSSGSPSDFAEVSVIFVR